MTVRPMRFDVGASLFSFFLLSDLTPAGSPPIPATSEKA